MDVHTRRRSEKWGIMNAAFFFFYTKRCRNSHVKDEKRELQKETLHCLVNHGVKFHVNVRLSFSGRHFWTWSIKSNVF